MIPTTIEYDPFSVSGHAEDSRDSALELARRARIGAMRQQLWTAAYPRPFGTRVAPVRVRKRIALIVLLIAASVALHAVALFIAELAYAPYRAPSAHVRLAIR